MITTKKLFSALVALSMSIVMVSCSGEDGETGPKGPAGNANVNSDIYPVAQEEFTVTASPSGNGFRIRHRDTLDVPALSSSVLNSGAVQVYFNSTNINVDSLEWTPMPINISNINFNSSYAPEEVRVEVNYLNAPDQQGNPQALPIGDFNFKVVVIPSASLVEGVDMTDYDQVSTVYGIEEFDIEM